MRNPAFSVPALALLFALCLAAEGGAQETARICEVTPKMKCLEKSKLDGTTIKVDAEATAIEKDGFVICDSSYGYVASPDIVLIMDNTGSMKKYEVRDGLPRWCHNEADGAASGDPQCISGDPDSLRGPALKSFLDSALVKGGNGVNVGVVLFSQSAYAPFTSLQPLNAGTIGAIKDSIIMDADGQTNYYAAFKVASDLLKTSKKSKDQQIIIFVSDGRPNYPTAKQLGDPLMYKDTGSFATGLWNTLPPVHCIFLGDNTDNFKEMQEIRAHTGGSFFNISDVHKLASYLTDSLAQNLFRTATPTQTTVRNITTGSNVVLGADHHIAGPDSTWVLDMPGPLYLKPGVNDILVQTIYGDGNVPQTVHFNIQRATDGGPYIDLAGRACRDRSQLLLYNNASPAIPISITGDPYLLTDKNLNYVLTTGADLDSLNVVVQVQSLISSGLDAEVVRNDSTDRHDSTWSNSIPFQHQQRDKHPNDGKVQVDHGESVVVTYHNPYIPEDSARASVRIKYGVDVVGASYWDLDGDGRIETVKIQYQDNLGALPDLLGFTIVDARGNTANRSAHSADDPSKGEIRFGQTAGGGEDRTRLVVTLKSPFDYGVTSVSNPDNSGHTYRQDDVPMVDGNFRVDDSVPPVVLKAELIGPDGNKQPQVKVTYSEPVRLSSPSVEPVVFKRDSIQFTLTQMPIAQTERVNASVVIYHLGASAEFIPVGGDFIAINDNGETSDTANRAPTEKTWRSIDGGTPRQAISAVYVTFANGSHSNAQGGAEPGDVGYGFIPVDSLGRAIPGEANGKCGGCNPGAEGSFTGSVIGVETRQPVNYVLTIYSNLGELVASTKGKVEEADLPVLARKPTGEYVQRIVWNGRTTDGQMAGTGAYVLKAEFHFEKSFRTGAPPSNATRLTRFGYLRSCCGSSRWQWPEDQ
jgi:hypothetical protein